MKNSILKFTLMAATTLALASCSLTDLIGDVGGGDTGGGTGGGGTGGSKFYRSAKPMQLKLYLLGNQPASSMAIPATKLLSKPQTAPIRFRPIFLAVTTLALMAKLTH